MVLNGYYTFCATADACAGTTQFQACFLSNAPPAGNVSGLYWQLFTANGCCCIADGTLSSGLSLAGIGCGSCYVLNYQIELSTYAYTNYTPFTYNYGGTSCVLPIELLYFTGTQNKQGSITLTWATETETNNNYFTIERSIDGNNFMDIVKVKGASNSTSATSYTFTDKADVAATTLYYRLSQTDDNGMRTFFTIIEVNRTNSNEVSLYPNPASQLVNLKISEFDNTSPLPPSKGDNVSVEIYNTIGECVHRQMITSPSPPSKGETYTIDVSDLAEGVYQFIIHNSEFTINKRVVIVR